MVKVKDYNYLRVVHATHKVVDKNGHTVFIGQIFDCVAKASTRTRNEGQRFTTKPIKEVE